MVDPVPLLTPITGTLAVTERPDVLLSPVTGTLTAIDLQDHAGFVGPITGTLAATDRHDAVVFVGPVAGVLSVTEPPDRFAALDRPVAVVTELHGGLSTFSDIFQSQNQIVLAEGSLASSGFEVPTRRINISTPTIVYLVGEAVFTSGTVKAGGTISARRVR
jgi:hypothetical protein